MTRLKTLLDITRGIVVWQVYLAMFAWGIAYIADTSLREDELWKTIGTLLIGTAFVNSIVSSYFAANLGRSSQQMPPPEINPDDQPVPDRSS
jgi:hypothetical protein